MACNTTFKMAKIQNTDHSITGDIGEQKEISSSTDENAQWNSWGDGMTGFFLQRKQSFPF